MRQFHFQEIKSSATMIEKKIVIYMDVEFMLPKTELKLLIFAAVFEPINRFKQ